jgi:hypothetical protein
LSLITESRRRDVALQRLYKIQRQSWASLQYLTHS